MVLPPPVLWFPGFSAGHSVGSFSLARLLSARILGVPPSALFSHPPLYVPWMLSSRTSTIIPVDFLIHPSVHTPPLPIDLCIYCCWNISTNGLTAPQTQFPQHPLNSSVLCAPGNGMPCKARSLSKPSVTGSIFCCFYFLSLS